MPLRRQLGSLCVMGHIKVSGLTGTERTRSKGLPVPDAFWPRAKGRVQEAAVQENSALAEDAASNWQVKGLAVVHVGCRDVVVRNWRRSTATSFQSCATPRDLPVPCCVALIQTFSGPRCSRIRSFLDIGSDEADKFFAVM